MENKRRSFLKLTGLAGFGVFGGGIFKGFAKDVQGKGESNSEQTDYKQQFNMSGYAAPKLDTVRIGFIGLGQRGPGHLNNMTKLEGIKINGLCDIRESSVKKAAKLLDGTSHQPTLYSGDKDAWKKLCEREDIDAVYIATPWDMHVPMAVYAMEHGKHAFVEVPAAITLDQCWQLVETSERTRKHCMMLENCCYDFFELLTLNMARQGYFGDIIHGEGAYLHNLLGLNFDKNGYYDMWRLKQNATRNGNIYPTHGLGPLCQLMNINRGDKMDYPGIYVRQ
jgi:hypothetical protein